MANGKTHQTAGAVTGALLCMLDRKNAGSFAVDPFSAALIGSIGGRLPDILEPALHPNHRQFFHSFFVAVTMFYGMKKLYGWEPETAGKQLMRQLLLIGGGAYLSHLLLDSFTKKSLPIVGKI
ncbi:metal-dependent hydrolase [Gallaecimonas sp. GXIMD4217]|uniref:metal-dependent hydrolase n=1 Tax=Gallaecimonas sp. GXIMD4217 TaxID=3131927 RepID=UPI00311AE173